MPIKQETKTATCEASAFVTTASGKEQLALVFRCQDGEVAYWRQNLETEKNLDFAEQTLKVLGWNPDDNGWDLRLLDQTGVVVGREASVVIEEDDSYDGKPRRRIVFVNALGAGGLRNLMDAGAVERLTQRVQALKLHFGRTKQDNRSHQKTEIQGSISAQRTDTDDDVPF